MISKNISEKIRNLELVKVCEKHSKNSPNCDFYGISGRTKPISKNHVQMIMTPFIQHMLQFMSMSLLTKEETGITKFLKCDFGVIEHQI